MLFVKGFLTAWEKLNYCSVHFGIICHFVCGDISSHLFLVRIMIKSVCLFIIHILYNVHSYTFNLILMQLKLDRLLVISCIKHSWNPEKVSSVLTFVSVCVCTKHIFWPRNHLILTLFVDMFRFLSLYNTRALLDIVLLWRSISFLSSSPSTPPFAEIMVIHWFKTC